MSTRMVGATPLGSRWEMHSQKNQIHIVRLDVNSTIASLIATPWWCGPSQGRCTGGFFGKNWRPTHNHSSCLLHLRVVAWWNLMKSFELAHNPSHDIIPQIQSTLIRYLPLSIYGIRHPKPGAPPTNRQNKTVNSEICMRLYEWMVKAYHADHIDALIFSILEVVDNKIEADTARYRHWCCDITCITCTRLQHTMESFHTFELQEDSAICSAVPCFLSRAPCYRFRSSAPYPWGPILHVIRVDMDCDSPYTYYVLCLLIQFSYMAIDICGIRNLQQMD